MTLTRFFIAAFIFLGTTISAADFVETSNSVNEPELVLELNRLLQTPDSFDRALRQKKTVLPQRLLDAQRDRMRDITFPTLYGLEEPLTQHFMEYYTRSGGLKWLAEVLESGAPYLAFIREEIAARNMPPELLYLPVIESGFVAKAYSSSGAAGFWQFMRNSIRPYMNITEWIDERYDFWKATHGALSKLQNNYNDYNSWDLALAAYNSGSGAVSNTLKKTGINDYWTLANQKLLKRESIYYVPKLIAIYYIVSNPRMFGLDLSSMPKEHLWTRINVDKQINLSMLAEYAGVDYNELRRSNSELLYNLTPPDNHLLKVKVADAEKIKAVLERDDIKLLKYYTYIIKSGDTLSALAQHYGVSVDQIIKQNPGLRPSALKLGSQIIIPAVKEVGPYVKKAKPAPTVTNKATQKWSGVWTVKKGDTLWSIARAHNIKPEELARENGIGMNSTLSIGKKLKVPR